MSTSPQLARYDRLQSYDWNYAHPPRPVEADMPGMPGRWDFCGLPVGSPLGVAAGPLLNSGWVLYYASLGFDVLTYKTVRSVARECYPMPNLVPVRCEQLDGTQTHLPADEWMAGTWAVLFGMPSRDPAFWRADVAAARDRLPPGKVLSVSVVGSMQPNWTIDELAADYAQAAKWAVESGAQVVETNFSCPNVTTCDGRLYREPATAALVAARVRDAIGSMPYIIKIGHLTRPEEADALVEAVAPFADALAMTNSVATPVTGLDGALLFDGRPVAICGAGILQASLKQTAMLNRSIAERRLGLRLIGVGGAAGAADVRAYLDAGAHAVHMATAAMINPTVALDIRREW